MSIHGNELSPCIGGGGAAVRCLYLSTPIVPYTLPLNVTDQWYAPVWKSAVSAAAAVAMMRGILPRVQQNRFVEVLNHDCVVASDVDHECVECMLSSLLPDQRPLRRSWTGWLLAEACDDGMPLDNSTSRSCSDAAIQGGPLKKKTGTAYFPQYGDAITDISAWGNFS